MHLILPLPPNRANDGVGWHWRREHRMKGEYFMACLARYGKPPPQANGRMVVSFTLYTHNPMDDDNATARVKFPLDWLVQRGYVVNDTPSWVDLRVSQEIDRGNQRAEVEIFSAADEVA